MTASLPSSRFMRWAPPLTLAVGLALSGLLGWLAQFNLELRGGRNVAALADQLAREIRNDIDGYGTALRGLHGLYLNSPHVDRAAFRRYVDNLRLQHDVSLLQRFSYIERVEEAGRAAFEQRQRRDPYLAAAGLPDFTVKAAATKREYFVLTHAEPLQGNAALLGLDLADLPGGREVLSRVVAGGSLTLSGPFIMSRAAVGDTGMVIYLPLYATGDPARPLGAKGGRLAGLVGVTINIDKSMRQIAEMLAQRHVNLRLTELERSWSSGEALPDRPFFDSAPGVRADDLPAFLSASRELDVLGNRWRLDVTAEPASMTLGTRFATEITLAFSLTITLLLFLLVRNLGRTGTLAAEMAEKATADLRQSEEKFRDLAELSSDWFWEQDAQFRFTAMVDGADAKGNFAYATRDGKTRWELPVRGVSEEEWVRHRAQLERHDPFRNFVYSFLGEDGRTHWCSVNGKPVFTAGGRFAGYRGTGHDITRAKQAEENLRTSEERLTLALEATAAGIWDYDPINRISYFSPRFAELLGYPGDEDMRAGFFLREALHPDDRARVLAAQARALSEESRFDETYRLCRRDGSYRWFRGLGLSHVDAGGHVVRFTGAITDITAQRESDEALRESEARLNKAQAIARLGSWHLDIPANRLAWSRETCRLFGIAPDTPLTYDLFLSRVHPEDRDKVDRAWSEALAGKPYDLEHRIVVDGETRWVHELADIAFAADGQAVSGTGTVLDITEQKQAETQLRLAATVYESSLEGVTIADAGQRILSVNRAFTQITGYTQEEVLGKTPRLLQSGRHGADFYRAMWDSIRRHGFWRGEIWNRRKDGEIFPELLGISAVRNAEGETTHYIGMFTDISEIKRSEEAMRRFNAELERRVAERTAALTASNRELEAFSYSVSHDLRAPLRAIDGFSQIIAEDYADRLDATAQGLLERIRAASQRMALATDAMLDLARLARIEVQREDVDLSALAGTVAGELPDAPARHVELVIAPGIHASADRGLIHIVLQNLIHNAWKFTGQTAAARIEFGMTRLAGERVFFVRDNGAGFDPAYASKLFGAFQRLHRPDEFAGTGIGLASVQRIVQRHGGRVWAEGAVGQGATFYFTLG